MAKTVTFTLSETGLGSEGWHGLTWVSTGSFLLLHWEQTEARGEHERRMGGPAHMQCSHPGKGGSGVPPWQLRKRWGVVDSVHVVKDTVRWIRDWEKEVLRVPRRCLVWSHLTWDEKEQDWGLTTAFTMWKAIDDEPLYGVMEAKAWLCEGRIGNHECRQLFREASSVDFSESLLITLNNIILWLSPSWNHIFP